MDRIRTLVVDEHRVFAESLATALSAEPDVTAVAAGGTQAAGRLLGRARASGEPFHVLLADAGLLPEAAPRPTAAPVTAPAATAA
ncbi:DNA-binding response regulator, partial [Streptomyces lonarensis]|nr:DNA-binding response regulator [Streptomyces lonarensis]